MAGDLPEEVLDLLAQGYRACTGCLYLLCCYERIPVPSCSWQPAQGEGTGRDRRNMMHARERRYERLMNRA